MHTSWKSFNIWRVFNDLLLHHLLYSNESTLTIRRCSPFFNWSCTDDSISVFCVWPPGERAASWSDNWILFIYLFFIKELFFTCFLFKQLPFLLKVTAGHILEYHLFIYYMFYLGFCSKMTLVYLNRRETHCSGIQCSGKRPWVAVLPPRYLSFKWQDVKYHSAPNICSWCLANDIYYVFTLALLFVVPLQIIWSVSRTSGLF